jgi:hypothetical protein
VTKVPPKAKMVRTIIKNRAEEMGNKNILYIGHSYHQKTKSTEFFIKILSEIGTVRFVWDNSWITKQPLELDENLLSESDYVIVFQQLDAALNIPRRHHHKMLFVPMYDAMAHAEAKLWKKLRGIKVLCFSQSLYLDTLTHGIESLYVQYYPRRPEIQPQQKFDDLNLFFWQRLDEPNLKSIGESLDLHQFKKIRLHAAVDPGSNFTPPSLDDLAQHSIEVTDWFKAKEDYIKALAECNIFIAPRRQEGIGMSFLEALSRGMIIIGHDDATLNEYVTHGLNGLLLEHLGQNYKIHDANDISNNATRYFQQGIKNYENKIPEIKEFITKPSNSRLSIATKHALSQRTPLLRNQLPYAFRLSNRITKKDKINIGVDFVVIGPIKKNQITTLLASIFQQKNIDVVRINIRDSSKLSTRTQLKLQRTYPELIWGHGHTPHDNAKWQITLNHNQRLFDPFSLIDALSSVPPNAHSVVGDLVVRSALGDYKKIKTNPKLVTDDTKNKNFNSHPSIKRLEKSTPNSPPINSTTYYSNTTIFQLNK